MLVGPLVLGVGCDPNEDGDDVAADEGSSSDDGTPAVLCEEEDRDEDFAIGLAHEGESLTVTIADAEPSLPVRGDNAWTLTITDAGGAAMEGMLFTIAPWMPDHGHGSPVEPTTLALGEGQYLLNRLNLFMAGYWEITLGLSDGQGTEDEVVFRVCVE